MRVTTPKPRQVNQWQPLACQGHNAELFFAERPADVDAAKALCNVCPVRSRCLAGAVSRREPWGVWGGELFLNGRVVPHKRARGRPRKNPDPS